MYVYVQVGNYAQLYMQFLTPRRLTVKPGQVHCRIAVHNDRRLVAAGQQVQAAVEARALRKKLHAAAAAARLLLLLRVNRHRRRDAVRSGCVQRERTTARRLVHYHNNRHAAGF